MNYPKSVVLFLGILLGLSVALYLGGKYLKPETSPETANAVTPLVSTANAETPFASTVPKAEASQVVKSAEVPAGMATATFGAGCFWCTEAVFQRLKGVLSVVSGYSGGSVKNPTYRQVSTGTTGHAEAIQVTYDPAVVSYEELLEVFWQTHDPTTQDRQGNDSGPQYRSAIFYNSNAQKQLAEEYKKKLDASGAFDGPIITQIVPFTEFFRAEEYHQNYYNANSQQPYCRVVIGPKLAKLKKVFQDKLKASD
jgi:peptide-methionine (S)-S-oxide reductase